MSSNRVKGITVEINGSTTGLDKALSNVNRNLKDTQTKLKDVDRLLKLDPKNTVLLEQKQKLLKESISQTKEKLQSLKSVQDQMDSGLKNGSVTKDQYDAWQREIAETEQALKSLEQAQKNMSTASLTKMNEIGTGLQTAGEKMTKVGTGMTKFVTAPVVGLGVAAIKTAADFDSSMSKVAAVSGATGEDFDALRSKAREMGAKTKFSASEAAEAMNYMAMAGWKTGDMLSGIEGIMNLAAASGEDLATTSDIVTDALTAFGLSASDSSHFADILAAASSNANTNVSMMGETFKYVAPIAGAMGYSAEDTAEAIGLMANAGIKSSQAGTTLRKIMTELNGEIKIVGNELGETVIQTSNADGSMRSLKDILKECRTAFGKLSESEQASNAEALVGKQAMSGFLALMNAAPGDIEKLEKAIDTCSDSVDGYNGVAEKMSAVMQDNLAGQLTILKSQLAELAISIGDALMPIIRDIVSKIQEWVDKFNNLDDGTKKTIVKIAMLVAALGPVLSVVGKLTSGVGGLIKAIAGSGGGGGLIGGVKSLVTGIKGIITNGGPAASALKAVGTAGAAVGAAVAGWTIGGKISDELYKVGAYGDDVAGVLEDWFSQDYGERAVTLVRTIGEEVGYWVDDVKNYWHEVFHPEDAPKWKREGYKSAEDYYHAVLERTGAWEEQTIDEYGNVVTVIHTKNSELKKDAVETVNDLTDATKAAFGGMPSDVADAIAETNANLKSFSEKDVKDFTDATSSSLAGIPSDVAEKMAEAQKSIEESANSAKESFAGVPEDVRQKMAEMKGEVDTAVDATKSSYAGIPSDVAEKMAEVKGSVNDAVDATKSNLAGIPSDVAEKMAQVKGSVEDAVDTTKSSMAGVPPDVADKMAKMKGSVTSAVDSTKQTLAGVPDSIRQIMEKSKTPVEGFVDATKSSLAGIPSDVAEKMSEMSATTKNTLDDVSNKFHGLDLSLPKVKLPHFSIQGKFSLNPLSVPHLSIDWYKKAMDNGMILNSPTIFGAAGGKLLGAGEAGPEAVVGADSLRNMIMEAVASQTASLAAIAGSGGDITIPVYIGGNLLDETIVTAQQRMSLRSGGR